MKESTGLRLLGLVKPFLSTLLFIRLDKLSLLDRRKTTSLLEKKFAC